MQPNDPHAPLWRRDESLREVGERLAGKLSGIRVVSFDFFDTLVSRLCAEPPDLFIEAGRRLAQRDMLLWPLSPAEFRAARQAADERARQKAALAGRSPEIKLADIYAEMHKVVRDPAAACKLEFGLERLFCCLNPAMASLVEHVRSLGFRTAILSDTYFTAAQLGQFLADNGSSPMLFNAILTSSERGRAKWNGHLYHDLFRHFDIHPSELLHIGDNSQADIAVARSLGAETVHYYRTTPGIESVFNGERALRGANVHRSAAFDSLRVLTGRQARDEKDAFRDGAMIFGPVLSRFADWAVQRFAGAGVHKVLALMREGELLGQLLQRAANSAAISLEVVPCYSSRLSTALAAMSEVTPQNAASLLEGGASLTPQAVLEILGLNQESGEWLAPEIAGKALLSPDAMMGFLRRLFQSPRLRQQLDARHKESFGLAYAYLADLAGEEKILGVMDLGWSGSIQRNLGRILRRGGHEVRTVGCYLACRRRAGRLSLDGDTAHAYMDEDFDRSEILPEAALTACVGSTDGYARDASGKVTPVLGAFDITPEQRLVKERLREGVLAFQSRWLALCSAKGRTEISTEMLGDLDRNAAAILYRLLDYPTQAEAGRLGSLRHDENYFGRNYSAPLCDDASPVHLRQEGVQGLYRAAKCYWPQGVVARQNPRLVSALRGGWSDPLALGRLGAAHGVTPAETALTDEEAGSLGDLLRELLPGQVIFYGRLSPAVEELFLFLWRKEEAQAPAEQGRPKLIVLGPEAEFTPGPEFVKHTAFVANQGPEVSVCRSLRARLACRGNTALVFPSQAPPAAARAFLHGLAPFLGPNGVVLAACGRYDPKTIQQDAPLAGPAHQWSKTIGMDLGYTPWPGPSGARAHLCNWMVFRRAPQGNVWNRQWMFHPGDNFLLR